MDDAFLFVGVVAGDDSTGGFGLAEVDGLVGEVGGDEEEVAGFAGDGLGQTGAVARLDTAGEDVDGGFVAAVEVGGGRTAGGNDDEVHGEGGGPGRLAGDADEVGQLLAGESFGRGADDDDVGGGFFVV